MTLFFAHLDDVAVAQPPEAVHLVVKGAQLRHGRTEGPDPLHSHLVDAVLNGLGWGRGEFLSGALAVAGLYAQKVSSAKARKDPASSSSQAP